MEKNKIDFIPIGGLGEIGRNMMLVRSPKTSFVIDAGVQFPHESSFGLKYLISNFHAYLAQGINDIVITHAHEDHIGALPYILNDFPHLKIHCGEFAAELIKHKCLKKYHSNILTYGANQKIILGDFLITFVPVNHSIPETFGLFITHEITKTCCFYISDFKIENGAPFEETFSPKILKKLSKNFTTKLLFIDSTNILSDETKDVVSEAKVNTTLKKIIKQNKKRTFITLFASNLHRIKGIIQIAEKEKRPLFYAGRAIEHFLTIGKKTQILSSNIKINDYSNYDFSKDKNPIFLLTGCQGDFKGALGRISLKNDPIIKIEPDDLFIFSSKTIPGNETKVNKIINDLSKVGCEIITSKDESVHSSGHATKSDIKEVIKAYSPTHLIPIHGEYYFLKKHYDYLKEIYSSTHVILINNQDELSLFPTKNKFEIKKFEELATPLFVLDHDKFITKKDLNVKKKLAQFGTIFVSINFPKKEIIGIDILGVSITDDNPYFIKDLTNKINSFLIKEKFDLKNKDAVQENIRLFIQKNFKSAYGEKSIIIVHILY